MSDEPSKRQAERASENGGGGGRMVLVRVTALDGGLVVIQGAVGAPFVLQGDAARLLHQLACDPKQPMVTTEAPLASRALDIVEKFMTGGG